MSEHKTNLPARVLRWIGRIGSLLAIAFVVIMNMVPDPQTGRYAPVAPDQAILALLFPGLIILGLLLAWFWHRQLLGGLLIIACFPLFVLVIRILQGQLRMPTNIFLVLWLLIALPGVCFVLSWYLELRRPVKPNRP